MKYGYKISLVNRIFVSIEKFFEPMTDVIAKDIRKLKKTIVATCIINNKAIEKINETN